MGQPVAYRLVPGENCPPLAQPDAAVMRRAGFAAHQFWVTPYRPEERYPAGDYPNQHPGGDGLPLWTAADRRSQIPTWSSGTRSPTPTSLVRKTGP